MSYAIQLYKDYYLEYASYVIKERAIPDVADGFKPVQRRIMHTLMEMDDGKFHKVANVVGAAMRYHPHGDSSIYGALVTLANYDLLIEKQGNYGNFLTGDDAAAARYIECRLLPIAKKILYNPEITEYQDSYDGRNQEPVVLPAKVPVLLIQGTEGIGVGMSTRFLPHNALEVLEAQKKALRKESFQLLPDFPGGGIMDASEYKDGFGPVSVRAKLDISDPKRIVITELPFGVNCDSMIKSIDDAAHKGSVKIAGINDYTSDKVNIEITLPKGVYAQDVVNSLYAYTLCQTRAIPMPLVIREKQPVQMTVTQIVEYHAQHLIDVLTQELNLEIGHLEDRLHARTLERIFVEERIYKRIEQKRSQEAVKDAVVSGFAPFASELFRPLVDDDVERLLKIPIRRISLFDIEKNRAEIDDINASIDKCRYNIAHIVDYALGYLNEVEAMLAPDSRKRKTTITSFSEVGVKDVAQRDQAIKYDPETGYLGTELKVGSTVLLASIFDKIVVVQKDGTFFSQPVPTKAYVGKDLAYCGLADKDELGKVIFTIIFTDSDAKIKSDLKSGKIAKPLKKTYIKRTTIGGLIANKIYQLLPSKNPEDYTVKKISTLPYAKITSTYKKGLGYKSLEDSFLFTDFRVVGTSAGGVILTQKEVSSMKITPLREVDCPPPVQDEEERRAPVEPDLFGDDSNE